MPQSCWTDQAMIADEKFWPKFTPDMTLYEAKMRERKLEWQAMKTELTTSLTATLTASLQSSLAESLRPSIEMEVRQHVAQQAVAIVTTQTQSCVASLQTVCEDWESALKDKDMRNLSVMVCSLLYHS